MRWLLKARPVLKANSRTGRLPARPSPVAKVWPSSTVMFQASYKNRKSCTSFENKPVVLLLPSLPQGLANRVQADYAVLAPLSRGLSGGDILNICLNAIHAGSVDADPAKWRVTQEMMENEIAKARRAKAEHSEQAGKPGRRIGFGP